MEAALCHTATPLLQIPGSFDTSETQFLAEGVTYPVAQFRYVLFDLDGTLVDTADLIVRSFQHALHDQLGMHVAREQVLKTFGEPLRTTMIRLGGEERADALVASYRAFNVHHHDKLIRPFPGVARAVSALHAAGLRLAVTTSKLRDTAMMGLRHFRLDIYMDVVVGAERTHTHKPDPEPLLVTLGDLGGRPGPDVLMVGDSPADLLAGRRAGVRTAAVEWSVFPRAALTECNPNYWISDPGRLVALCLDQPGTASADAPSKLT